MLTESHQVRQADRALAHVMDVWGALAASKSDCPHLHHEKPAVPVASGRAIGQCLELHGMTSAKQIAALLDHQIDVAFLRPPG